MKRFLVLIAIAACIVSACNSEKSNVSDSENPAGNGGEYFEFSVDDKTFNVDKEDVLTTYNEFNNMPEFKIYAGKEGGPTLTITIPANMSGPSSTPSGSAEPGSSIAQGSVSLQGFPDPGDTYNNFDFMADTKLKPVKDAVVVTSSEKIGEKGRMISGTIHTTTYPGPDGHAKPYTITGRFSIMHVFSGLKF